MGRLGYSSELKESIKKRFQSPNPPRITELTAETGISITTLYSWRRETGYTKPTTGSPHRRSADEKWRLITEAEGLSGEELGTFLRREGLYLTHLDQWKREALEALKPMSNKRKVKSKKERDVAKRIKQLEAELKRKDAALAEAAALLLLSKKAEALWAEEDDGTAPNKGKISST
jgi:hypothetical protein